MNKKLICGLLVSVAFIAASVAVADVVGDFEGVLGGWRAGDGMTLSFSATGATVGTQALQVDGPGGWHIAALWDAKPQMTALGGKGVKITADVTAVAGEMTSNWMQVEMVINAQNNNDNGANNNLGWNVLGGQDVAIDGQPHTCTWTLADDLVGKIAAADDNIGWFELVLVSNVDTASATRFYIDNIQIVSPQVNTGKSTDTVIGDWEQSLDGWVVGGGADVRYSDANGVTLGQYSLDVWTETGAWASVLTMNLLDPNNANILAAFRANTKLSVDITHLVVDWPEQIPPWNGTHLIINTDAAAVPSQAGGYINLGYKAGWSQTNGDRTDTATWDYSQVVSDLNANWDKVTYLSLEVVVNANSADYTGWVWFYLDNMRLSGGGIPMNLQPANGAKDVDVDTLLSWTGGVYAASHNLYLGTSSGAVAVADGDSDPSVLFVSLDGTSFDPNGLQYNTQYFWRIDAVNDVNPDGPWTSGVWTFTTGNFLVVDDFESYQDVIGEGKAIFDTWLDGWQDDDNGSIVGYDEAPFTQDTITGAYSGRQVMPLRYDNTTAAVSKATRTWTEPQDWTVNSFNTLRLFVAGKVYNVPGVLYITLEDGAGMTATVERDIAEASVLETWTELEISFSEFTGVDVASVTSMVVGVKNKAGAEKAVGTLLIDAIRAGVRPMGLVAHYKLEGNLEDSSGNGFHGTFGGDANLPATYVTGPTGFAKGMLFDGTGGHQNVELGTFNPSAATGQLTVALWAKWDGASDQWQGLMGKRDAWTADDTMWHLEVNKDAGTIGFARWEVYPGSGSAKLPVGTWAHVAVTFDGTTARFYLNGVETGNGAFSFGPKKDAGVHFGSDDPNGGNAFNGALDDVRLYDTAMSAEEVQTLMTNN